MVEFELRSLPGVVAAAVEEQAVTVLALPDADADALRVVIAAVLATHGMDARVQVLGGMASPSMVARRGRRVLVGAVGGVSVFATVAVAAAATGGLPFPTEHETPVALPAASEAAPATPAPVKSSGITVVPGAEPEWAAEEGAWPLPATLPTADIAPPPAVVPVVEIPAAPVAIEPPPNKLPLAVPSIGAIVTTGADAPAADVNAAPEVVVASSDDEADKHGHGHGHDHDDQGLHLGWENGPAHAAPNSAAATAPRGQK
jgi:hypothetical protein